MHSLRNAGVGLSNSLSPSFANLFTGILYGVYQEGSTKSVNLTNCTFNDIRVAGVYSQNASLTRYFLKFLNCNFAMMTVKYLRFLIYLVVQSIKVRKPSVMN